MDLIFQEKPTQCYLDTYLYDTIRSSKKEVTESKRKVPVQLSFQFEFIYRMLIVCVCIVLMDKKNKKEI
jgi:hypothetical protein